MPIPEDQVVEYKRAYQILGVPCTASAASIKTTYHRMARRWHPDRYPSGIPAQVEATHMMKLINQAYRTIEHAPLRYCIDSYPSVHARRHSTLHSANWPVRSELNTLPVTHRIEFWARFICGGALGAFIGLSLILNILESPVLPHLHIVLFGILTLIFSCGFAAARYGDSFWWRILERSWLWWW